MFTADDIVKIRRFVKSADDRLPNDPSYYNRGDWSTPSNILNILDPPIAPKPGVKPAAPAVETPATASIGAAPAQQPGFFGSAYQTMRGYGNKQLGTVAPLIGLTKGRSILRNYASGVKPWIGGQLTGDPGLKAQAQEAWGPAAYMNPLQRAGQQNARDLQAFPNYMASKAIPAYNLWRGAQTGIKKFFGAGQPVQH
jgi:hypothetical protein